MRKDSENRKNRIIEFINTYTDTYGSTPSIRDISAGTDIPQTSVNRLLRDMNGVDGFAYEGAHKIKTEQISSLGARQSAKVLGFVNCGPGETEEQQLLEYISLPESLVGKGTFFSLIAKGYSMIDEGIRPGDYIFVRRQNTAKPGDIVIALYDGLSNCKRFEIENGRCILRSCNSDKEHYPDIIVDELEIQGVVVGAYHRFE